MTGKHPMNLPSLEGVAIMKDELQTSDKWVTRVQQVTSRFEGNLKYAGQRSSQSG